jgi:hypothetical protein
MSISPVPVPSTRDGPKRDFQQILMFLGLGLAACAAALGFATGAEDALAVRGFKLIGIGAAAFLAGCGVSMKSRDPKTLALAAVSALFARWGADPRWDSARMLFGFATLVAGGSAVLMFLPQLYRRIIVSGLVLLHFGAILTATTSPNWTPWLSGHLGMTFYRPYMQFMYLTNAYHFYSPEPGPANVMWFCIYYDNGDTRWYKTPRRPEDMTDPLLLSYYRRLAITQQIETPGSVGSVSEDILQGRSLRAQGKEDAIPFHPEIQPIAAQFRVPNDTVRHQLVPAYIRFVARANPHDDPARKIVSIKMYRVEHHILIPREVRAGVQPYDPDTYRPWFLGEYDAQGVQIKLNDPMLYWLVPIVYEAKPGTPIYHTPRSHPKDFVLRDCVNIHSGSDHTRVR